MEYIYSVLIALLLCLSSSSAQQRVNYTARAAVSSLRLVQVLFRHGDRSPIEIYPSDTYREDQWPQGLGQLTQTGMAQAHELGRFFRQRYDGFLNRTYNKDLIYLRSSDIDRAILTAQNMLTGLYPGITQTDAVGQQWIPVQAPVHSVKQENDRMIVLGGECPRYEELVKKAWESPEAKEQMKQFQDIFDIVANSSGYEYSEDTILGHTLRVADTLVCEKSHNLSLPNWATESFMERLRTSAASISYNTQFCGDAVARLRGGVLLKEMINNMKNMVSGSDHRKMFVFSGHDTTVGALLCALGLFNNIRVPYTTTVIMELHQAPPLNYTVRFFLRNSSSDLYSLTLQGCNQDCPVEQFLELTSKVVPSDIEKECKSFDVLGVRVPLMFGLDKVMTITVVATALGLALLVILICCIRVCHKCCRRRKYRYRRKVRDLNSIVPETVKLVSSGNSDSDEEFSR